MMVIMLSQMRRQSTDVKREKAKAGKKMGWRSTLGLPKMSPSVARRHK